jgi:hypothetical protein
LMNFLFVLSKKVFQIYTNEARVRLRTLTQGKGKRNC